jgi:hypothetical protein
MLWLLILFVWIFICYCANIAFCGMVASAKGYPELKWTLLGVIFPVVALIAIAGLPDLAKKAANLAESKQADPKNTD